MGSASPAGDTVVGEFDSGDAAADGRDVAMISPAPPTPTDVSEVRLSPLDAACHGFQYSL